ncbi:MAG: pilus assembly protein TadG-related protein [Pseudomonadota bacterium]
MRTRLENDVQNERANVTIAFAIMSLPIMAVAGFSIDNQRHVNLKQHAQYAADVSVLAGARSIFDLSLNDDDLRTLVTDSYNANLVSAPDDASCGGPKVFIDRSAHTVTVEGECTTPTTFGVGISGHSQLVVRPRANAKGSMTQADIALAIDISGSMANGGRLNSVKTAVENMTDVLINPLTGGATRLSFAAFSNSVNAGVYGNLAQGKPRHDDSDADGLDRVCVTERIGPMAYELAPPRAGQWVGDVPGATCADEIGIYPLTSDADAFKDAVDDLVAGGGTAGHIGVAWAGYLISPEWASIWTRPPSPTSLSIHPDRSSVPHDHDGFTEKAVIILSDGMFSDWFAGASSMEQAGLVCDTMNAAGMSVYAIAFKVAHRIPKEMLKYCASSPDHYFEADTGAELDAVYQDIANRFIGARLTE